MLGLKRCKTHRGCMRLWSLQLNIFSSLVWLWGQLPSDQLVGTPTPSIALLVGHSPNQPWTGKASEQHFVFDGYGC